MAAPSARTLRRDKHQREAQTVAMLALARELTRLSREHPECADILNVAVVQVRWRSSATRMREAAILKCLNSSPMSVDELCEEIIFYPGRSTHRRLRAAITQDLMRLKDRGTVEARDRDGVPIVFREGGRPTRTPYYGVARVDTDLPGHEPPDPVTEIGDNQVVGSFSAPPRHR